MGIWVRGSSAWASSVVFRLVFLFCIINFGLYFLLSLEFTLGFFTSFLADEYVQQEKDSKLSFSRAYMKCSDVFWKMASLKSRVVDLIARNLREPKGLGGHFIRVSFS